MPAAAPRRVLRLPRSPLTVAAGALAVAGVVGAIVVVGPEAAAESPGRVVTATRGTIQSTVSGTGNLQPARERDLSFATGGTVKQVYVKQGEHVTAGQLIARIDDARQRLAVQQAQAALDIAETALEDARDAEADGDADASAGDAGDGGAGDGASKTTGATVTVASATADLTSAQLNLEDAEQALEDTRLRAPITGTITALNGAVGDSVSAAGSSGSGSSGSSGSPSSGSDSSDSGSAGSSSSAFASLAQLSRLNLEVSFSESDIGKLKVGQAATVTVTAVPGTTLTAKVSKIGILSSTSSGVVSYPVTLAIKKKAKGVLPGMSATAEVVVKHATGVSVPSQALLGPTVLVQQGDKQVRRRVGVGLVGDNTTQIRSGLKTGEQVVLPALAVGTGSSSAAGTGRAGGAARLGGMGSGLGGGMGGGGAVFRQGPGGPG